MHFQVRVTYRNGLRSNMLWRDLKTLKGARNRLQKTHGYNNIIKYDISQCVSDKYYNEDNWRVVETYEKYDTGITLTNTSVISKKEAK